MHINKIGAEFISSLSKFMIYYSRQVVTTAAIMLISTNNGVVTCVVCMILRHDIVKIFNLLS